MEMVVAAFCFTASLLTILIGVIYAFDELKGVRLNFDCGIVESGCNADWRRNFNFKPDDFVLLWTPLVLGLLSSSVHINVSRQWTPNNNLILAVLMLILAIFGDLG